VCHELVDRRGVAQRGEQAPELLDVGRHDVRRGHRGRRGLEDSAHLEQLQ
jgi:hypothetical protein